MTDALPYKPRAVRRSDRRVSMRPYVDGAIISRCLRANLAAHAFC
jgi:hypothetical protein